MMKKIEAYRSLSKSDQIIQLSQETSNPDLVKETLQLFTIDHQNYKDLLENLSENTIALHMLPLGVTPNVLINKRYYHVPMVTEESSVIAAAASASSFWAARGGIKASVNGTTKQGQVHFKITNISNDFLLNIESLNHEILQKTNYLTESMRKRDGGILKISWSKMDIPFEGYVKCDIDFETQDAMGANFINSCLEAIAKISTDWINTNYPDANCEVIMAILSNHYPDCTVTASVSAPLEKMEWQGHDGKTMSERFVNAVLIANHEIQRAVTHNKGIMNGVDSVVLATGNDFRAVEAACHAFASTSGQYRSLSNAWINDNTFTFSITLPLALGTIGGLTKLHPLAQTSLELLGNPSAKELMMIVASIGLMSNFAAVRALTSTGIQKGHMKLHLSNLLLSNNASKEEIQKATNWFKDKEISSLSVKVFLENLRNPNQTI